METTTIAPMTMQTHVSDCFVKMNLLGFQDKTHKLDWMYDCMLNHCDPCEIAEKYLDFVEYDGQYLTDTCSALFEIFINFKNGKSCSKQEKEYLSSRAGTLDCKYISVDGEQKIIIITVLDIIKEMDGPEFIQWLRKY
jgi:hypothetical protein